MYNVRSQTKPRAPRGQTWTKETQGSKTRRRQIPKPNQKTDSRGAETQACGDFVSICCIANAFEEMVLQKLLVCPVCNVILWLSFHFPFQLWKSSSGAHKGLAIVWSAPDTSKTSLQYVIRYCVNALEISFRVSILQYMQNCFCRTRMTDQRTVFLITLEMRTLGAFWLTLPLKDCGCLWGKRWRSCSVSKPSDAFTSLFKKRVMPEIVF